MCARTVRQKSGSLCRNGSEDDALTIGVLMTPRLLRKLPPAARRILVSSVVAGLAASLQAAEPAAPAAEAAPAPAQKQAKQAAPTPTTPAELLATASLPPEFDAIIFATPAEANYPVFVSAAADGTVYVASDANSSLGVDLGRGRVVRLRDTDGDGRADEVRQFAKMDSPRGLVWDGDRLYLMHPPHLSAYIDKDGDGVSDEERVLIKNVAFSFRDRPADHSSNGVTLGLDGWLYLAIGDFGFMEAEGTDGRKMQLRGGAVVRVRPDGTEMEMFSSGTRNILEVALSPKLDGIARDNTNDGGGWDVRLHHFTGMEEHGYPTLFKNFQNEMVAPLADYGGGSGTGGLWLDEPGIPEKWNKAPITVDWGRERMYRHPLTEKGATFTAGQEEFARLPRATDLDVDAQSRLYLASWRGGQYTFGGNNVGYIVRMTPKDFKPAPLPDFAKASGAELVALLKSPSARLRLDVQRTLLRRDLVKNATTALETLVSTKANTIETRIIALFTLKQGLGEASHAFIARQAEDPSIAAWAIRALTDRLTQLGNVPDAPILAGLRSGDPRTRKEALIALARLGRVQHATAMAPLLGDADPIVAHTAVKALSRLKAADVSLAVIDDTAASETKRLSALQVVQTLHDERVVDQLIARLAREKDAARREGLIRVLARLYHVEGKWTGDSWGTRPDTRGPYYQPERWAGSEKINTVLKDLMDKAEGADAAKLNEIFTLYRVSPGDSTARLIALSENDPSLLPTIAQQLAGADTVPATAIPVLARALTWTPPPPAPPADGNAAKKKGAAPAPAGPPAQLQAMQALVKAGTPEAIGLVLKTLPTIPNRGRLGDGVQDKAANALFQSSKLENHYRFFSTEAAKQEGDVAVWADAALLHIAARKFASPEAREFANKTLDDGWKNPVRRAQIVRAAALGRETTRATALVQALDDPDAAVAAAAKSAVATLKLDVDTIRAEATDRAPLIVTLKSDDVIAMVMEQKGSIARGEQLFAQAACVACHTVNASDPLKGPFLGNIARTYQRRELAESILEPNRSLAQGFATNQFTLKNGTTVLGFVTRESADVASVRDITGQQHEIKVADVARREHLTTSLMPPGLMANYTVKDLASLLDYLASLAETSK